MDFRWNNSQWGAIPWSQASDGLFSLYENPDRDRWFRQTYPERASKVLVPLQDNDHTNEYSMAPVPFVKRDTDVLCVSRMHDLKNTPVVCFREFNQYIRDETPPFPVGAGLVAASFDAESLADTIHEVIQNQGDFRPRLEYLKVSGRTHFFSRCIDCFGEHYYAENLQDFSPGQHVMNLWLDLAIQQNYELSLNNFIYGKNHLLMHVRGLSAIEKMVKFYHGRFGMPIRSG